MSDFGESSEPPNAWLLDPIAQCTEYLAEEIMVAALSERGLIALNNLPFVLKAASHALKSTQAKAAMNKLLSESPGDARFAQEEITKEFPKTRAHSSIGFWAAIESCVEEVMINHLSRVPDAYEIMAERFPNAKHKHNPRRSEEDNHRKYVKDVESTLNEPNVVRRYQLLLGAFHLSPELQPAHVDVLTELSEVRNVILHRRSMVDRRFLEKCPHLKLSVGQKYSIDRETYLRFYDACSEFNGAMMGNAIRSPWIFRKKS